VELASYLPGTPFANILHVAAGVSGLNQVANAGLFLGDGAVNAKERLDIEEFIENPIFNFSLRPHDSGAFVITGEETSPGRLFET
jgi:hypothetical protein